MKIVYYTNKGKVRNNNEDSLLVISEVLSERDLDDCEHTEILNNSFIVAVADGMGGHEKGEVASKIVLETLKELTPIKGGNAIEEAIYNARKKLEEYVKNNPDAFGLGCAIAGLVINENEAYAFNVGDCRVYRYVNEKIIRLTRDHSIIEGLVLDGIISREEAKHHPKRNVLTSAVIGDGYASEVSVFITDINLELGGRFLVCSDGLWDELSDEEIKSSISAEDPCKEFLKVLDTKPLKDNVSFIVLL